MCAEKERKRKTNRWVIIWNCIGDIKLCASSAFFPLHLSFELSIKRTFIYFFVFDTNILYSLCALCFCAALKQQLVLFVLHALPNTLIAWCHYFVILLQRNNQESIEQMAYSHALSTRSTYSKTTTTTTTTIYRHWLYWSLYLRGRLLKDS